MINDYGSSNSIPIKYVNINLMLGDVNYSGNLTSDDSTAIQDYLLHLRTFSNLQKKGKIERVGSKRDGIWVVVR